MIKRIISLLFLVIFLVAPAQLSAQSTTNEIESLGIEFWPDYDQTAVLVLLTGFLSADTALPVTLTVSLPENADLNAVAHITADNVLTDQGIEYEIENNELTFTSPSAGFRIEFYLPYQAEGLNRAFSYTWQNNNTAVNDLRILIQEPLSATSLSTVPSASASPGNDGLTYHTIPSQNIAAGELFTIDVNYVMSSSTLTSELLSPTTNTSTESQSTPLTATPIESNNDVNWPLLLGGLGLFLIIVAAVWQVATRRATVQRPVKPKRRQAAGSSTTRAKFCRQCGNKLNPNDKFCRDCGTAVKQ